MSLEIGQRPKFATPAELANGSGRGAYAVVGGALAWDPRFDQVPDRMWPLRRGGFARVGSVPAAVDAYTRAVDLRATINRLEQQFGRMAGPGWRYGDPVPASADRLLTILVNAEVQWGTMLRVLGKLYRAANLLSSVRPAAAARQGIDLQRILRHGRPDPISRGAPVWLEVTRPAGWEAIGVATMQQWIDAYPERAHLPLRSRQELEADFQRQADELATMGAWPAWLVIVVVLIAAGTAIVIANRVIGAIGNMFGVFQAYLDELVGELADAHEKCLEGDEAACERWREIAERIEGINPPLASVTRMVALGAAVGLALWLMRRK